MPTDFIGVPPLLAKNSLLTPLALAAVRLALLRELEASLLASQKAVQRLDLESIERGTCEQVALVAKLAAASPRGSDAPTESSDQPATQESRHMGQAASVLQVYVRDEAKEPRLCAARIMHAARVQGALLARMQGKLRVLSNMLAGPGVDYALMADSSGTQPRVVVGNKHWNI
jgi:hypothetical protein